MDFQVNSSTGKPIVPTKGSKKQYINNDSDPGMDNIFDLDISSNFLQAEELGISSVAELDNLFPFEDTNYISEGSRGFSTDSSNSIPENQPYLSQENETIDVSCLLNIGCEINLREETHQIWNADPDAVTHKEYVNLYSSLMGEADVGVTGWLAFKHFVIQEEGMQIRWILYVPWSQPLVIRDPDERFSLRVEDSFVFGRCEDLLPEYFKFFRGVVEGTGSQFMDRKELDLLTRVQNTVLAKTLEFIQGISEDKIIYKLFNMKYSKNIKEGIMKEKNPMVWKCLVLFFQFYSSYGEDQWSLREYVRRMVEGQKSIYFLIGESRESISKSILVEQATKKGYEVLFIYEEEDKQVVQKMKAFDGRPLKSLREDFNETETDTQNGNTFSGQNRIPSTMDVANGAREEKSKNNKDNILRNKKIKSSRERQQPERRVKPTDLREKSVLDESSKKPNGFINDDKPEKTQTLKKGQKHPKQLIKSQLEKSPELINFEGKMLTLREFEKLPEAQRDVVESANDMFYDCITGDLSFVTKWKYYPDSRKDKTTFEWAVNLLKFKGGKEAVDVYFEQKLGNKVDIDNKEYFIKRKSEWDQIKRNSEKSEESSMDDTQPGRDSDTEENASLAQRLFEIRTSQKKPVQKEQDIKTMEEKAGETGSGNKGQDTDESTDCEIPSKKCKLAWNPNSSRCEPDDIEKAMGALPTPTNNVIANDEVPILSYTSPSYNHFSPSSNYPYNNSWLQSSSPLPSPLYQAQCTLPYNRENGNNKEFVDTDYIRTEDMLTDFSRQHDTFTCGAEKVKGSPSTIKSNVESPEEGPILSYTSPNYNSHSPTTYCNWKDPYKKILSPLCNTEGNINPDISAGSIPVHVYCGNSEQHEAIPYGVDDNNVVPEEDTNLKQLTNNESVSTNRNQSVSYAAAKQSEEVNLKELQPSVTALSSKDDSVSNAGTKNAEETNLKEVQSSILEAAGQKEIVPYAATKNADETNLKEVQPSLAEASIPSEKVSYAAETNLKEVQSSTLEAAGEKETVSNAATKNAEETNVKEVEPSVNAGSSQKDNVSNARTKNTATKTPEAIMRRCVLNHEKRQRRKQNRLKMPLEEYLARKVAKRKRKREREKLLKRFYTDLY